MGKQPIVIERSMQNHSMAAIRKQDMMRGMQAYDDWCTAARAAAETTPALDIAPRLDRATMAMAVRYSLHQLVAPYAVVKILEGPASDPHNLTPPDVIELDPQVWLRVASGITTWHEEQKAGRISAVGERDDLSPLLPLG